MSGSLRSRRVRGPELDYCRAATSFLFCAMVRACREIYADVAVDVRAAAAGMKFGVVGVITASVNESTRKILCRW